MALELVVVLEGINALLLLFLLYAYVQNYREMPTNFGIGLILFAALLLLQNGMGLFFYSQMAQYYSAEAMGQGALLTFVQTVALAILTLITWKQ